MDEPYFIEVDENGCAKCGAGRMWTVIGPDGDQHHTSFADEDDAAKLAEDLNDAYHKGKHEKQREMRKARETVSGIVIPPADGGGSRNVPAMETPMGREGAVLMRCLGDRRQATGSQLCCIYP